MIDRASLVGFDPQPDPPSGFDGSVGFTFGITTLSDAIVRMRILDGDNILAFTTVAEPATLGLVGLGLTALAWRRRARR